MSNERWGYLMHGDSHTCGGGVYRFWTDDQGVQKNQEVARIHGFALDRDRVEEEVKQIMAEQPRTPRPLVHSKYWERGYHWFIGHHNGRNWVRCTDCPVMRELTAKAVSA